MKTLIKIIIVTMFGIEICSPFFIGYLNQKEKLRKMYSEREAKCVALSTETTIQENKQIKNWKSIDFSENNYSDSKTLIIKE
jgi:hypothetical protein